MQAFERGARAERARHQALAQRRVVGLGKLAHLAIELQLAQPLHRERPLMFEPLGLGRVASGAPGRQQAAAQRRRDEQRDARDDQHGGEI